MMRWALALLVVVASIAGLILGVLNPEPATLDLGFYQLTTSLGALIALAVALGIVLGLVITPFLMARNRRPAKAHRAQVAVVSNKDRSLNG